MVLTPEAMKIYTLLIKNRRQWFSALEVCQSTGLSDSEFTSGIANLQTEINGTHISLSIRSEESKHKETMYNLTSSRIGHEPTVHEQLAFPDVKRFEEAV